MTAESAAGKVRGCDENQFGSEMSRELFHPFVLGFLGELCPKKVGGLELDQPGPRCDPFIQRVEVLRDRPSVYDTRLKSSLRTRYGVQNTQRHTFLCRLPLGGMATSCLDLGVSWAVEVLVVVQQPMGSFNGLISVGKI